MDRTDVEKALREAKGSRALAATRLGTSASTLYRWLRSNENVDTHRRRARGRRGGRPRGSAGSVKSRPCGEKLLIQIERDDGKEYLSISDSSGAMCTVAFASNCERVRFAEFIGRRRDDEEDDIVATMQVSRSCEEKR